MSFPGDLPMSEHETVHRHVQGTRERIRGLHRRADEAAGEASPVVREVMDELSAALEELQVAGEELRTQNEALAGARDELEAERARWAALFDLAPDACLATDEAGAIHEANRAARALLGTPEGVLEGKPLAVFAAPGTRRELRAGLQRAARVGRVDGWGMVLVPRGGEPVEVEATVATLPPVAGEPPRLLWTLRAGGRAGWSLDEVLEATTDAFYRVDRDWRLVYVNARAEALWNRPRAELLGRALWEAFPQLEGSEVGTTLRGAMERGGEAHFEGLSPVVGRRLEVHAHPGDDGLFVFLRDVEEQRRDEEGRRLLAEAGEALAASLDPRTTAQGIARLAAAGLADYCIVHVEAEGEVRSVGIAHRDPEMEEELRALLRRFPGVGEGPHPVVRTLRTGEVQVLAAVTPAALEAVSTGPEHREALEALGIVSAMVAPVQARERTLGAMSFLRAAGRAPFDARDLELARDLARRAGLAMDNARLYEEAKAAARVRDDLLAVVSHDLRNPLNAILIGATLLDELSDPERMGPRERRQLEAIRRAAEQMTHLIRDLVDVVGIESGARTLERHRHDPGTLLAGARDMFEPIAAHQGIELVCEIPGELPPVHADHARILQVLSNLVGNAVKFTGPGGVVTLRAEPHDETAVCFSVSDTGPGIGPDHLPRIFDRFWQGNPGGGKGLGLGLAIARGLVEAHGGRIWVETVPETGSTFRFTLPVWSA